MHINAYVKNKTKNGDFYWVFANVTASVDVDNKLIGYYSVRRKPSEEGRKRIETLYASLLQAERVGGVNASLKLLNETLNHSGVNYDEFVIKLQK